MPLDGPGGIGLDSRVPGALLTQTMADMVGRHIGKYRVTRQVGRGGMGTVYAALDETLHREVAIKVLNAGLDDPTVAKRFRAEAVAIARLNHPGIATIYELLQHDGQWLMVMEFVRGETLEQACVNSKTLPVERAADIAMQMLAALAHAHSLGVVHRDLKPANIMLAPDGTVKIMDFGIARVSGAEQLTSAGFMMGTPAYMAPEQVLGGDIDGRTDLYAVGIVLFQMVTGAMPFNGSTAVQLAQARVNETPASLHQVRPDMPAWLGQVIDVALARDPADRFASATEFRDAMRRGLAGVPIESSVKGPEISLTTGLEVPPLQLVKSSSVKERVDAAAPARTSIDVQPLQSAPVVADDARPGGRVSGLALGGIAAVLALGALGWWFVGPPVRESPGIAANVPAAPIGDEGAFAAEDTPATTAAQDSAATDDAPVQSAALVPDVPPATPGRPSDEPPAVEVPPSAPAVANAVTNEPVSDTDSSAMFRGVRALVLDGRRAQERPAVLSFADGAVTLFDDSGRTALASMPYRQVTAAAYTRAREPRWYPTLAGPPIDTDMPGGFLRGDRHWLALQSRDMWMIVRMNDSDWQSITATVTRVIGIAVDQLRP